MRARTRGTVTETFDSQISAAFDEAIRIVRKVHPSATLAGGAVRDWCNGRQIKDLDIAVVCGTYPWPGTASRPIGPPRGSYVEWIGADPYLMEVEEITLEGIPWPIQLVHLATPPDLAQEDFPNWAASRNDFGICQCRYVHDPDGPPSVWGTGYFFDDLTHNTFTLVRNDGPEGVARSLRRWERIKERYPNWTLVNRHG